jgi:hypothetical protein
MVVGGRIHGTWNVREMRKVRVLRWMRVGLRRRSMLGLCMVVLHRLTLDDSLSYSMSYDFMNICASFNLQSSDYFHFRLSTV